MKTLLRIVCALSVPSVISSLIYASIGMDHFFGDGVMSAKFLSGERSVVFLMVISILSFFGVAASLFSLIMIFPLVHKMENYEAETMKLHEEQKAYAQAKKKLISAALNFKNNPPQEPF